MSEASIDGIAIVASDFEAQVAFYRDLVGLDVVDHWGDACRLRGANGVSLTIFASTHDERSMQRLHPAGHGLSHLEFGVSGSVRTIAEQRLRDAGQASYGDNFVDADGQLLHYVTREF